ncbi:MAG: patatin-like phospholipase family protein [Pseudomonadota bacterium]|nr:patatin-like phospholipase family protein [Pseudomonadota bacterium]MED5510660.1 patatin-like phospholipase family protein [Pseudomonadota bacterium]
MKKKVKIGLALGSGAARGWAHIGVIQQLIERGIEPDVVCGSSIGALVGAAYVSGNINKLQDWVTQLDKLQTARYFTINRSLRGFVNKDRLHHFLDEFVVNTNQNIEDLDKTFATVATDLNTGREIWNTEGKVLDSVWSSISLPGLFPAIKHDDRWLIDGGLVNPVPVSVCRALGADVVIAVNLNSDIVGKHFRAESPQEVDTSEPANPSFTERFTDMVADYTSNLFSHTDEEEQAPDLMDAIAAAINITQDRITRSRMAGDPPEIILSPRLSQIGILEFYRGAEAIEEGKASVERHQRDFAYFLQ